MHTSSGYDLQSASFAAIESKPSAGVASNFCSDVAVYWDNTQPECLRKLYRGSTETPMGLQVIYSCSCQLVLPKHAVSGTLRLTALHVHFIGEVQQPPDDSGARSGANLPVWLQVVARSGLAVHDHSFS